MKYTKRDVKELICESYENNRKYFPLEFYIAGLKVKFLFKMNTSIFGGKNSFIEDVCYTRKQNYNGGEYESGGYTDSKFSAFNKPLVLESINFSFKEMDYLETKLNVPDFEHGRPKNIPFLRYIIAPWDDRILIWGEDDNRERILEATFYAPLELNKIIISEEKKLQSEFKRLYRELNGREMKCM